MLVVPSRGWMKRGRYATDYSVFRALGAERYRRLAVAVNVITPKDLSGPSRETANVLAPRLGLRLRRPLLPTVFSPSSVLQRSNRGKETSKRARCLLIG